MKQLNVCFVGIGSIARRHIKNLQIICTKRGISLNIDAIRQKTSVIKKDDTPMFGKVYRDYEELDTEYDAIFITNPTEYHIESLKKIMKYGRNFFIEKPVSSVGQIRDAENLRLKKDAIYYVACTLRYSAVIQYLKNNVDVRSVISVRSISSSFLPDWRPGTDYRKTYSASKQLGGGVSTDLIHEWDYLTFLMGMPQKIFHMSGKISTLEIDSEDYAIYIAEYTDKIVELHLDYFGRETIRQIMVLTNSDTICGDMVNNRIKFLKSGEIIDFQEERDDYQIKELIHFLDLMEGTSKSDSDITHAINVLKLTQGKV